MKIFFGLILLFISIIYYENKIVEWNIKEIILDKNYLKSNTFNTKFVFIFNEHNKTVYDKTNAVDRIYGVDKSDINITILNFKRVIIFKKPGILKTIDDSIDVENSYVKLRGYMGIRDKEHKDFYVDKKGMFQIKKQAQCSDI